MHRRQPIKSQELISAHFDL